MLANTYQNHMLLTPANTTLMCETDYLDAT